MIQLFARVGKLLKGVMLLFEAVNYKMEQTFMDLRNNEVWVVCCIDCNKYFLNKKTGEISFKLDKVYFKKIDYLKKVEKV